MAEEKLLGMKLEDILTLSKLRDLNTANDQFRQALRKHDPEAMEEASTVASNTITNGDVPEYLLNATPQAWNHEITNYRVKYDRELNAAFEGSREGLLEFYAREIDMIRGGITAKIDEDERTKGFTKEQKQKILERNMYQVLALMLSRLKINPECKDKELLQIYLKIKELEEAEPQERTKMTAQAFQEMYRLSDNAPNLLNWDQYTDKAKSIYGRIVAKKLLNEKLKLDRDKFNDAFGTIDSYAQIASLYQKKEAEKAKEK